MIFFAALCIVAAVAARVVFPKEVQDELQGEFEENPEKVWEYNMFGRSLYDMVSDGMTAKLSHMPDESREKLGETLGKIINEGNTNRYN